MRRRWYSRKIVRDSMEPVTRQNILTFKVLGLDFQIVGSEAIVFTNQSGEAIQTISATLGSLDGNVPLLAYVYLAALTGG
jgi:hypothetical protein